MRFSGEARAVLDSLRKDGYVLLEGKQYDGWPVARLIFRERQESRLLETVATLKNPDLGSS